MLTEGTEKPRPQRNTCRQVTDAATKDGDTAEANVYFPIDVAALATEITSSVVAIMFSSKLDIITVKLDSD